MTQARNLRRRWSALVAAAATLVLASAGIAAVGLAPAATDVRTLAATAGCGTAPTLTSGTHSITSGGQNRTYILRIPDNYDQNHPYRLIFGLHWLGGSATDVANGGQVQPYYGLQALADNSAIFVAPQGLDAGWANPGGRDVTFVDDMISLIENDLCVDTEQVFSLGWSFGGGMSFALACARPEVFRAVAVYSGGLISGCSGGNQPVAYMGVHGLSDDVLSIAGGRSLRDQFVGNNGCTPANPPEPAPGSGTHTSFTYSGCSQGHPVAWHAFDGGHTPTPTDFGGGPWLPAETWSFFTQFESTPSPTTTPPTTTPPVTTSPPATSTSTPGACSATYQTVNSWPGGFQGEVTVQAGSAPIDGWTVQWTLAGDQTIIDLWNGEWSVSGSSVTVTNLSWNGMLGADAETTFGFVGSGSPSEPATPTCTSP